MYVSTLKSSRTLKTLKDLLAEEINLIYANEFCKKLKTQIPFGRKIGMLWKIYVVQSKNHKS